jgi:hypothetical protein
MENTEQLKLIIDLASDRGAKQERNEMLEQKVTELSEENAELRKQLSEKDEKLAEKDKMLAEKDELISVLQNSVEGSSDDNSSQHSGHVVVVNQYFTLSVPKTYNYVENLDSAPRMLVGHMFMHTLPDDTPKRVYDKVNEMTRLEEGHQAQRLVDAVNRVADRPAGNEFKVYPQSGSTANLGCDMQGSKITVVQDAQTLPASIVKNDDCGMLD